MAAQICTACGHLGAPKTVTSGSMGTEIILWLCLIIPGAIYSVWRLTTRRPGCALCRGTELIPIESPLARKFIKEFGLDEPPPTPPSTSATAAGRAAAKFFTKRSG